MSASLRHGTRLKVVVIARSKACPGKEADDVPGYPTVDFREGQFRVPPRLLRKYALRLWTTAQDAGKCLFRLSLQLATTTVSQKQLFKHLSSATAVHHGVCGKARIKYPWA